MTNFEETKKEISKFCQDKLEEVQQIAAEKISEIEQYAKKLTNQVFEHERKCFHQIDKMDTLHVLLKSRDYELTEDSFRERIQVLLTVLDKFKSFATGLEVRDNLRQPQLDWSIEHPVYDQITESLIMEFLIDSDSNPNSSLTQIKEEFSAQERQKPNFIPCLVMAACVSCIKVGQTLDKELFASRCCVLESFTSSPQAQSQVLSTLKEIFRRFESCELTTTIVGEFLARKVVSKEILLDWLEQSENMDLALGPLKTFYKDLIREEEDILKFRRMDRINNKQNREKIIE